MIAIAENREGLPAAITAMLLGGILAVIVFPIIYGKLKSRLGIHIAVSISFLPVGAAIVYVSIPLIEK